jgi:hypothetical protein
VVDVLGEARELAERRTKMLAELTEVLSRQGTTGPSEEEASQAMQLLGDLHVSTPAVVGALGHRLYYLNESGAGMVQTRPPDPCKVWPAFGALAKIGLPAVPVLVDEMRTQSDKDKRTECESFLNLLLGEHAKSWLAQALAQEEDKAAKARLEEALKYHFWGPGAYDINTLFSQPQEKGPWYKPSQ